MATDRPELEQGDEGKGRSRLPANKAIAAAVLGGLLVAFGIANSERVKVNFLVFTTHTRLFIVILVSALLGVGAVAAAGAVGRRRRSKRERS